MKNFILGGLLAGFCTLVSASAQAACSTPSGSEGALRYDKPTKTILFCDGTNWVTLGATAAAPAAQQLTWSGPLSPPVLGANGTETVTMCSGVIGSQCGGGFFAGDGNLVVTPGGCAGSATAPSCPAINSGLTDSFRLQWQRSDLTVAAARTGEERYGWFMTERYGVDDKYPAMQYCHNLVYNGFSDWYLPSEWELRMLYYNHVEIGGFLDTHATTTTYVSSTSTTSYDDTGIVPGVFFTSGESIPQPGRKVAYLIRCARRN